MSFLNNLVNEFTHQGQHQGGGGGGGGQQPPQCPPPWRAHWDGRENRWVFVNEQTGQTQHEFPREGGGYGGGYGGQQGGYGGQQGGYGGGYNQGPPQQQHQQKEGGGWGKMALGAAAGLAGGAFLAHEGHEMKEDYDEDKYRAEQRLDQAGDYAERKWDNGVNDVENFPENAARWTGDKVSEVEDIPQDIGNAWDRTEDRVEGGFDRFTEGVADVPEDVAGFAGRVGGNFERFGDNVDNAYDEGRQEGRDNDGW